MDEAPKEKENLLKRLFFNKDRLGAFMDAILAIIMTILVLELEKPSAPPSRAIKGSKFLTSLSSFVMSAVGI